MRVDLAAQVNNQCYNYMIVSLCMCLYQVLSESVSMALKKTGGEEAEGTSKFADMMDKFFDCLNVHNYTHGIHSRKDFHKPYTSSDDARLKVRSYNYRS